MGTAVEDPHKLKQQSSRMERKMASSLSFSSSLSASTVSSASPASAAANVAGRVARWRVGERISPPNRHDLQLKALRNGEAHPLVTTSAHAVSGSSSNSTQEPSREEKRPAVLLKNPSSSSSIGQEAESVDQVMSVSTSNSSSESVAQASQKQEMVVLQDGDIDPLGVLTAGLSDNATTSTGSLMSQANSSASIGVTSPFAGLDRKLSSVSIHEATPREKKQTPQAVKELWRSHKDRVLIKFENVTFKIKAVRLPYTITIENCCDMVMLTNCAASVYGDVPTEHAGSPRP